MNPLIVLAFWFPLELSVPTAPVPPSNRNIVRVCSVAAGTCQETEAQRLAPAGILARGGQLAFVDPETKSLVEPSAAQLDGLSRVVAIEESMQKRQGVTVFRLPNGVRKAAAGGGFLVYRTAVVEEKEVKP